MGTRTAPRSMLCLLGIHSYEQAQPPGDPGVDREGRTVCRRCGKLAPWAPWWGGRNGMTAGELKAALAGVSDDTEVEVESNNLFGWAGAESAFLTTKEICLATEDQRTVPVFRITGGEHGSGGGVASMGD